MRKVIPAVLCVIALICGLCWYTNGLIHERRIEDQKVFCLPPNAEVLRKQGDWWKYRLDGKNYVCSFNYDNDGNPYIVNCLEVDLAFQEQRHEQLP